MTSWGFRLMQVILYSRFANCEYCSLLQPQKRHLFDRISPLSSYFLLFRRHSICLLVKPRQILTTGRAVTDAASSCRTGVLSGQPDPEHISTSFPPNRYSKELQDTTHVAPIRIWEPLLRKSRLPALIKRDGLPDIVCPDKYTGVPGCTIEKLKIKT